MNFRHPQFRWHAKTICCVLAGHCLDAVQDRKCVFVPSGLKTISLTRCIAKEMFSFSISDIQSLTVKHGSSAACWQVAVWMLSRIEEMGLRSIWLQNNWLHKVHNHKKVSFSIFSILDTHCSAAIQGSSAACWQVTVWMLFRIGNVFSFYLV